MTAAVPGPWPSASVMPDYGTGGLFGIVRGLAGFLDGAPWALPGAAPGGAAEPAGSRILVFLLVDGLGDLFLQRFGAGSALLAARQRCLTSVFPSTTASAVTTCMTGLAPVRHGLTGWFIHDARFGGVIAPLPMTRRGAGDIDGFLAARRLLSHDALFQHRRRRALVVTPAELAGSRYSRRHTRGAGVLPYEGLGGLFGAIGQGLRQLCAGQGGLVHAYYPVFDAVSHQFGSTSREAQTVFRRVDRAFAMFCDMFAGWPVDVVVTADHGFIDSPPPQQLYLKNQPAIARLLAAPLSGERRAAFCHVLPGKESEFAARAAEWLAGRGVVRRSAELIDAGLFGPGRRHRRIAERTGTHTLLMEPGWTVIDQMEGETPHAMRGVHGGLSAEEMWIPLITRSLDA